MFGRVGRLILVTGGARSGKSRFAEQRVAELGAAPWLYLATAEALDEEMAARIALHRVRRGDRWRTIEEPRRPGEALLANAAGAGAALLDCVTLWLSNRMLADASDEAIFAECDALAEAVGAAPIPVVIVTNEVGSGIVPEHHLARRFRDLAGWCNQRLAARADEVFLTACGLPLRLK
jgi:adenosylcobinamide kinase/adenosylcobinamide-phosphate guanylyltransferase